MQVHKSVAAHAVSLSSLLAEACSLAPAAPGAPDLRVYYAYMSTYLVEREKHLQCRQGGALLARRSAAARAGVGHVQRALRAG